MYLMISIFLGAILGLALMWLGPVAGGILAFGIVAGCLFRGLYLLNKIASSMPVKDQVREAYDKYLAERNN